MLRDPAETPENPLFPDSRRQVPSAGLLIDVFFCWEISETGKCWANPTFWSQKQREMTSFFLAKTGPVPGGQNPEKNHIAFLAGNCNCPLLQAQPAPENILRFSWNSSPRNRGNIGPYIWLMGSHWWGTSILFTKTSLLLYSNRVSLWCFTIMIENIEIVSISGLNWTFLVVYPLGMILYRFSINIPILRLKITDLLSLNASLHVYNKCSLYRSTYSRVTQICRQVRTDATCCMVTIYA